MSTTIHAAPSQPTFDTNAAAALDRVYDAPVAATRNDDGSIEHNIDLSGYGARDKAAAEQLIEQFVDRIAELEEAIAGCRTLGRDSQARELEAELAQTKKAFNVLKNRVEGHAFNLQTAAAASSSSGAFEHIVDQLAEMPTVSKLPALELPEFGGGLDSVVDGSEPTRTHVSDCSGVSDTSAPRSSSSAKSSGAKSEEGIPAAFQKSPEELAAWFERDPQGFFEELNKLDSKDRGAILMMVQQQIQQTNQLFSALTNFQKAMHDTQKAMISNLRV